MSTVRKGQRSGDREKSLKDWIHSSSALSTSEKDDTRLANSSIAEDLSATVMDYFKCVWRGVRGLKTVGKGGVRSKIKKSLESFILWRHDFRDGRLDRALDHSETLKTEVLTVLYNMAKLLLRASKRFNVSLPADSSGQALGELLAKTADIIAEDDMEGEISSNGDSDNSSSNEAGDDCPPKLVANGEQKFIVQFCKDMCCHTENMSDLAASLDQTLQYAEMLTKESTMPRTSTFTMSDPAQVYVLNLLDKFPTADPKLVRRLAQKNWERHVRIRAEDKESGSIVHEESAPSLFKPFSQFHDSGLGLSTATIEEYAASAISSIADGERRSWRVPPLPVAARAGKPFTCDYCGQVLHKIKSRIDWKIHVFSDLQPYICTLPNCTGELLTFPKRALWAEHEFNVHRMKKTWLCSNCPLEYGSIEEWTEHLQSEHGTGFSGPLAMVALNAAEKRIECRIKDESCPFCLINPATTREEFVRHVGRHLEEVALAVLPIEDISDASGPDSSEANYDEYGIVFDNVIEPYDPASGTGKQLDALEVDSFWHMNEDKNDVFNSDSTILREGETGREAQPENEHVLPKNKSNIKRARPFVCPDKLCDYSISGFDVEISLHRHIRKYHPLPGTEKLVPEFPARFPTASPQRTERLVDDVLSQNSAAQGSSVMYHAAESETANFRPPGSFPNSPHQRDVRILRDKQETLAEVASKQPQSTGAESWPYPNYSGRPENNARINKLYEEALPSPNNRSHESVENDSAPREHPLYQNATIGTDGLFHCPWEGKDQSCNHKPEKLKCNYDKFVDSHLKPYRCKVVACENARFSSTACLLRHEREAHAMHGYGEKPFLCTFDGCERGVPESKKHNNSYGELGSSKKSLTTGLASVEKPYALQRSLSLSEKIMHEKQLIMSTMREISDTNDPETIEAAQVKIDKATQNLKIMARELHQTKPGEKIE